MREYDSRFRTIGTGLGLIYAGLCIVVLAFIIALVGTYFVSASMVVQRPPMRGDPAAFGLGGRGMPAPVAGMFALMAITGVMFLIGFVLDLVGKVLCLSVPPELTAATFLYVSLGLQVAGLLHSFYSLGVLFLRLPMLPRFVPVVVIVFSIVASILFMMFLARLAKYIRRKDLARTANSIITWSVLTGVIGGAVWVGSILALVVFPPFALLMLGVLLIIGIIALVILVRYANLLMALRRALFQYADGAVDKVEEVEEADEPYDDRERR